MKLRRVAISLAATAALALGTVVPALADHDTPDRYDHPNPRGGNVTCADLGLKSLEKIEYKGPQPTSVAVDPDDYPGKTIQAVIVKAGNSSFVYKTPPFEHMTGPDGKEISHIEVCGKKKKETPTPTPTPTEPTEEPTKPPTEEPTKPPTEEPTKPPTEEPTKPPTEPEKPAVPTEVPAGHGDTGSGVAGTVGLLAAITAALAAGAMLIRRRFLHEN